MGLPVIEITLTNGIPYLHCSKDKILFLNCICLVATRRFRMFRTYSDSWRCSHSFRTFLYHAPFYGENWIWENYGKWCGQRKKKKKTLYLEVGENCTFIISVFFQIPWVVCSHLLLFPSQCTSLNFWLFSILFELELELMGLGLKHQIYYILNTYEETLRAILFLDLPCFHLYCKIKSRYFWVAQWTE